MSTSSPYCCYTTLGNINFWFLDQSGWLIHSTKLFKCLNNDEIWPMKDFYCCILPWCWTACWCKRCFVDLCHYCDADIFQQGSVPAHWCVYQTIELLQRETPKFTGPGLWPPVRPLCIKEKVIVISELCWTIIEWKNCIFFSMCNRNI